MGGRLKSARNYVGDAGIQNHHLEAAVDPKVFLRGDNTGFQTVPAEEVFLVVHRCSVLAGRRRCRCRSHSSSWVSRTTNGSWMAEYDAEPVQDKKRILAEYNLRHQLCIWRDLSDQRADRRYSKALRALPVILDRLAAPLQSPRTHGFPQETSK